MKKNSYMFSVAYDSKVAHTLVFYPLETCKPHSSLSPSISPCLPPHPFLLPHSSSSNSISLPPSLSLPASLLSHPFLSPHPSSLLPPSLSPSFLKVMAQHWYCCIIITRRAISGCHFTYMNVIKRKKITHSLPLKWQTHTKKMTYTVPHQYIEQFSGTKNKTCNYNHELSLSISLSGCVITCES